MLPLPWAWVQSLVWGIKFPQVAQCAPKKVLTQTPGAILLGLDLTPAIITLVILFYFFVIIFKVLEVFYVLQTMGLIFFFF